MSKAEKEVKVESNLQNLKGNVLEQIFEEIDLFCAKVLYEKEAELVDLSQ
jgi:hypothetical protein